MVRRWIGYAVQLLAVVVFAGHGLAAEEVFFYHTDPAGTPLAVTDATGAVVWEATYHPFGEEFEVTGTGANDQRFLGKTKDVETGLNYFGARYLDASFGRFLAPDPVGAVDPWSSTANQGVLLNPQRLNLYAYGLNNPYRYVDPDGRIALDLIDVGFFAASVFEFASNPTLANAGNVVLDAIGLLPLVPSIGSIKIVGKALGKATDAARAADYVGDAATVARIIPPERSLSTIRVAGPDETFVRFESADRSFSKVTAGGGLHPGTYAAPVSELPVPISERAQRFALPDPGIPRTRDLTITAPGDLIIGPRPVVGGTGNEVLFPFGTSLGTVR